MRMMTQEVAALKRARMNGSLRMKMKKGLLERSTINLARRRRNPRRRHVHQLRWTSGTPSVGPRLANATKHSKRAQSGQFSLPKKAPRTCSS